MNSQWKSTILISANDEIRITKLLIKKQTLNII